MLSRRQSLAARQSAKLADDNMSKKFIICVLLRKHCLSFFNYINLFFKKKKNFKLWMSVNKNGKSHRKRIQCSKVIIRYLIIYTNLRTIT